MKLLALIVRQTNRKPTQIAIPAYYYRTTKIGSTNTSRQKKTTHEVPQEQSAARAFFYNLYNREILLDGQDLLHDAPTSAYQSLTHGYPWS